MPLIFRANKREAWRARRGDICHYHAVTDDAAMGHWGRKRRGDTGTRGQHPILEVPPHWPRRGLGGWSRQMEFSLVGTGTLQISSTRCLGVWLVFPLPRRGLRPRPAVGKTNRGLQFLDQVGWALLIGLPSFTPAVHQPGLDESPDALPTAL